MAGNDREIDQPQSEPLPTGPPPIDSGDAEQQDRLEQRRAAIRRRVTHWSERLRTEPRIVRIQHMTRKWGSCTSGGILTLARDLAEQESGFQDYVIVHELLHLRLTRGGHSGSSRHGRLFKALLGFHVPGWRKYERMRGM